MPISNNAGNTSVASYEAFSKLYRENPAEYVASGTATVKRFARFRKESGELKTQEIILGLQVAAPLQDFVATLSSTPAWIGKDESDYLRQLFNLDAAKGEIFPKDAIGNALVVMGLVWNRRLDGKDENGAPKWTVKAGPLTEANYLASSNATLKLLLRVMRKRYGADGEVNVSDPDMAAAIELASSRVSGFEKSLKEIAGRVEGKTPKSEKSETETAATVLTVRQAIAYLVAKAGDEAGLKEAADLADETAIVAFLAIARRSVGDTANLNKSQGIARAALELYEFLDPEVLDAAVAAQNPGIPGRAPAEVPAPEVPSEAVTV